MEKYFSISKVSVLTLALAAVWMISCTNEKTTQAKNNTTAPETIHSKNEPTQIEFNYDPWRNKYPDWQREIKNAVNRHYGGAYGC